MTKKAARKIFPKRIIMIIRYQFLCLFIGREPTTWQQIMVCSSVWLQITFYSCINESTLFLVRSLLHENLPFPSSPGLCIKTRLSAQPLIWKWFVILMQNQKKSCAIGLILKVRVFGTIADRFASRRYSLKDKLGDRMIKKIKHKISWFVSGEQITYLRQPSVSANDWSLTNHHILLNLVQ